jgi:hypothetical protein
VAVVIVAVCAAGLVSCTDSEEPEAWSVDVDGQAEVVGDDGSSSALSTGRHDLESGHQIRVTQTAIVQLPNGATAELRPGESGGEAVLTLGATPVLESGELLLKSGSAPARIDAGGVLVSLARGGIARVARSSALTVGVYQGRADLDARGRVLQGGVPQFRQVTISSGGTVPRRPIPLVYDSSDEWDIEYMAPAIALDGLLASLTPGITADSQGVAPDEAFLKRVIPGLASANGFDFRLLQTPRSVSELVIGASMALEKDADFAETWNNVFALRAAGAKWGLIAMEVSVPTGNLRVMVAGVQNLLQNGEPIPVQPTTAPSTPAATFSGSSGSTGTTPAPTVGVPTPTPAPEPVPVPVPQPPVVAPPATPPTTTPPTTTPTTIPPQKPRVIPPPS